MWNLFILDHLLSFWTLAAGTHFLILLLLPSHDQHRRPLPLDNCKGRADEEACLLFLRERKLQTPLFPISSPPCADKLFLENSAVFSASFYECFVRSDFHKLSFL